MSLGSGPLQELPCFTGNGDGALKTRRKRPPSRGGCDHGENTPQDLIQCWSPPHKLACASVREKENDEYEEFVLARRPRRRKERAGKCWDGLPDELLLRIFSYLGLRDLLKMSRVCKRWHRLWCDESLWRGVDLAGKAQLNAALGQVLALGVLRLRCPYTFVGEIDLQHKRNLRVQHMDLSGCNISTGVLETIISGCRQLQNLSLEGLVLSDAILQSLGQNIELLRLNLSGCSGFSSEPLGEMLKACNRLTELNISWCDFSSNHVKAVISNVTSDLSQLNMSGYRQNLTMEDVKCLVDRCPNLECLDLSDSVLVTAECLAVLQKLPSLRHLGLSRCYQIHAAALLDFVKFSELQSLEVFGIIPDGYLPTLKKGLPQISINTRCFSDVARPTPSSRKDSTIWGMHCCLVYKP
ncbi:S-phase kinase-associated protein 2 [Denticeps clupeoides]|uniref:S-phase kinase-associated protein 2 n=1 Tax=Denticeps clupeoides TaxID=299321 RepID=UPI0010A4D373|nr:S-phase kinase-associated protein 2 [Denticeps clupeoides]